jgi:hypothetical protein
MKKSVSGQVARYFKVSGCIPHAGKNLMQYASSKCQVSNELKPWNPRPTKASKPKILCIRLKSRYHVSKKVLALEIFKMTNLLNSYGSDIKNFI